MQTENAYDRRLRRFNRVIGLAAAGFIFWQSQGHLRNWNDFDFTSSAPSSSFVHSNSLKKTPRGEFQWGNLNQLDTLTDVKLHKNAEPPWVLDSETETQFTFKHLDTLATIRLPKQDQLHFHLAGKQLKLTKQAWAHVYQLGSTIKNKISYTKRQQRLHPVHVREPFFYQVSSESSRQGTLIYLAEPFVESKSTAQVSWPLPLYPVKDPKIGFTTPSNYLFKNKNESMDVLISRAPWVRPVTQPTEGIQWLTQSEGQKQIAAITSDGFIALYKTADNSEVWRSPFRIANKNSRILLGKDSVYVSSDYGLRSLDLKTGSTKWDLWLQKDSLVRPLKLLAGPSDGITLMSLCATNLICFVDVATGKISRRFHTQGAPGKNWRLYPGEKAIYLTWEADDSLVISKIYQSEDRS